MKPLQQKMDSARGTIGIPRVLNMYENYPVLVQPSLTKLGFRVQLITLRPASELYEGWVWKLFPSDICLLSGKAGRTDM